MLLWRHRHPVMVLALVAALSGFGPTPRAAAHTGDPVYLGGNPQVQQDRIQLLREEFEERQREIREQVERAKHHRGGRGRKVEPVPPDPDYAGVPSGASRSPYRTLTAPANVLVNNKVGDAAGAGQSEQVAAFLGLDGLCAWNNGQGFNVGPDVQAYGWTVDGGATWNASFVPLKQGTIRVWASDPVVTVNEKTAEFYYCGLTYNTGTDDNGVGVMRGHFAGGSFITDASTVVASGPSSSQQFDKEWMCADSSNGNLYVTWSLFFATGDAICFSRSTDDGATWSAPLQISGAWENGRVQGSRPMVGPDGEVYVQYTAIGPVDADSLKIAKSTDGGVSFEPSVVATTLYDNFFDGAPGFNRARAVTLASGAVDRTPGPNRGRVYLAIHDCVNFFYDPLGGPAVNEVESNSGFANATPFTAGQTLRGAFAGTSDQDNWRFEATQGTTYIFYVDSLGTSSMIYSMRIYCPNDTTVLSRLALSGSQATVAPKFGIRALIVWTAPTTDTYYLRMVPVTNFTVTRNQYRIVTGIHTPSPSDVARDTRDVVVTSSPDGVTGWTTRNRVNDDAPLYDDWLPEISVPCDGNAYAMWFDWRDTPASCFGGSNIYLSRSTDGGATWSANQVVTTAVTPNWTQVASNIAPNLGDYNGMCGGDAVALSFADGRLGDADVFAARLPAGLALTDCPPSQVALANRTFVGGATLNNLNGMFGNAYRWTLAVDVAWPGFPMSGSAFAGAGGSTVIPFGFFVPDTATNGEVAHCCLTVNCAQGGCAQSCCFDLTISHSGTGTLASLASASADPGTVRLSWLLSAATSATVERSGDGTSWSSVGQVTPDGSRMATFVDRAVQSGFRYAYRLTFAYGGTVAHDGLAWVTVPRGAEFALRGAVPNPASHGFLVSFSLPSGNRATLELIDLSGRRLVHREVGDLGAGSHTMSLGRETAGLPAGVYALRLAQGSRVLTAKVSVVR